MLERLRAWLAPAPAPTPTPAPASAPVDAEMAARLKTIARAQSKISLRLDDLVDLVNTNHRAVLEHLDTKPTRADELDDVLDALDRLDDARRTLPTEQLALAEGLSAIGARLERFIAGHGIVRHASVGVTPDGRRVRVVGTQEQPDLAEGVVTRVIRSAATRGDELLREGEVIINRSTP